MQLFHSNDNFNVLEELPIFEEINNIKKVSNYESPPNYVPPYSGHRSWMLRPYFRCMDWKYRYNLTAIMKPINQLLNERGFHTIPITAHIRICQYRPCFSLLLLTRMAYETHGRIILQDMTSTITSSEIVNDKIELEKSQSMNTIAADSIDVKTVDTAEASESILKTVEIDNIDSDICMGYHTPVLVHGHYVLPYPKALLHLAELCYKNAAESSSDMIIKDFIENSVIKTFEKLKIIEKNSSDGSKYGAIWPRLSHSYVKQMNKYLLLTSHEDSSRVSKKDVLNSLDSTYALVNSLINSKTSRLWSKPIPTTGEHDHGYLVMSEALLFNHLVEALAHETTRDLIENKYPALKVFYDTILDKYFVDLKWIRPSVASLWKIENKILATNRFLSKDPRYDTLETLLLSNSLVSDEYLAHSKDERYEPCDLPTTWQTVSLPTKLPSQNAITYIASTFFQNQIKEDLNSKTVVSFGGLIFSALVITSFTIFLGNSDA